MGKIIWLKKLLLQMKRTAMKFFVPGKGEEQKGKLDRWQRELIGSEDLPVPLEMREEQKLDIAARRASLQNT